MCDVTSCILLVLPESVPVTAQSITPRCSAGVTSPNGIVTGIAPNPAARSDIDLLNTRTFLPLRSAPLAIGVLHQKTCGGDGNSISNLTPYSFSMMLARYGR